MRRATFPIAAIAFSDKLQIEMLRAYRPDRFKTPGTQVNIGAKSDIFVLTEEQRHKLMEINRQWLLTSPLPTDDIQGDTASPNNAHDLGNANAQHAGAKETGARDQGHRQIAQ